MKKKDLLLIVLLLCGALAGLLATRSHMKEEGAQVVITLDGEIYGTYPLNEDQVIEIRQDSGYNKVVISDGTADVTEADCPDKICADHEVIRFNHETIVCLPHKLVVEIKGGEDSEIDVKTH